MHGILIGVTGPARAGKGTVGRLIRELRPDWTVHRDGFADRLKLSAAYALGVEFDVASQAIDAMNAMKVCGRVSTRIEFGQYDTLEVDLSGREFLQRYGTESHRDVFGEDFWIKQVLPDPLYQYAGRSDRFDVLVIDDLRYDNEAERIKDGGGVIWRVEREPRIAESEHASERGVAEYLIDRTIDNAGSLDDLRASVAEALGVQFGALA